MTHLNVRRYNKPLRNLKKGDLCWVRKMRYENESTGYKDRPILVISVEGDFVRCRKCTSQLSAFRDHREIIDLYETGLSKETYVDMEIIKIPVSRIGEAIGHLSRTDAIRLCY